jgi:hypothetical protein
MLPNLTLPTSLRRLLDSFVGCFTKPTFLVFTAMVVGMVSQTGKKTICGMLAGAGLAQSWSHDRAHRFFAKAVWSIDAVGLVVLDLVVTHLIGPDAVILLAVDDTAHRRRGKRTFICSSTAVVAVDLDLCVMDMSATSGKPAVGTALSTHRSVMDTSA